MKRFLLFTGVCLACLILTASAAPTIVSLDWWTVDGGGGASSGQGYTVEGTTGQPDAGPSLSGRTYSLTGGYWTIDAPLAPLPDYDVYLPALFRGAP